MGIWMAGDRAGVIRYVDGDGEGAGEAAGLAEA